MKASQFSDSQKAFILKQGTDGVKTQILQRFLLVMEICLVGLSAWK